MLWEVHQQGQIHSAQQQADRAARKTDGFADDLKQLRRHVDRLSLACQSLWELVKERTDLTEADIEQRMLDIDLRDGVQDGKIGMQIIDCPQCHSKTNSRRQTCIMCGTELPRTHHFDGT
ncbi:hypothetical protein FEM03_17080 [Phragmitibacter flavus]|uniref:Uncharacterized protein n=1 Tax=Phragmitibacter flavus TaxID=2576071 RepID=A0A5R8KDL3_9BACT|nr:hypothetical protein [Phragmitibacter flavus]TLD69669.1 hypothetical protein FEM03_17080 [Phragmitibacter flavus]